MNGNLRVTPEKLTAEAQNFASSSTAVRNNTTEMLNIVKELQGSWAGEAATAYYNKLNGLNDNMEKIHKMINEHSKDLTEMAQGYSAAEKANAQTASSLKENIV